MAGVSVVKVIEESLSSAPGCLFPYRNIATGETDADGITALLVAPLCRWTGGEWEGQNDLPWNAVQNTPRHIRVHSNRLIRPFLSVPAPTG